MRLPCGAQIVAAFALCLAASPASAHGGLHLGAGTLTVSGARATLHMAVAAEAFAAFDTNADGALDAAEVSAQREAITGYAAASIALTSEAGEAARVTLVDVNPPAEPHPNDAPWLRVTVQAAWDAAPERVTLAWTAGPLAPVQVRVSHAGGAGAGVYGVVLEGAEAP